MRGYPRGFSAALVATTGGLLTTGLLLLPTALQMRFDRSVGWHLSGGCRIAVTALHALGAFAMMGLLGAVWAIHIRQGWKRRRNRRSGLPLTAGLVLLAVTGVGLYYLGDPLWAESTSALHTVLGLGLPLFGTIHWLGGRRIRRTSARS